MQAFLEALYGDLPEGALFYLWTLGPPPDEAKATHWCETPEQACAKVIQTANIYWPIGWGNARTQGRFAEKDVAGIVALVADVDLKDDTHPRAPTTEQDALDLIDTFPQRPSACVHSGHGLQCAWIFKEPWPFADNDERKAAKHLSQCWAHTLTAWASKMSYELDSVHDLARIMRLPGTMNVKDPERPVPSRLLWLEDRRYNPDSFDEFLIEPIPGKSPEPLPVIDISTDFPLAKHEALLEAHDGYKAKWLHTTKNPSDNTASGYDNSLACILLGLNWPNNEIAAVLREHQRRWGNKPQKVNDTRYYAKTIANARGFLRQNNAREDAGDVIDEGEAERDEIIAALATRMEVPLTNIQLVSGDPSMMRFWISGKCAEVPATQLDTPKAFMQIMISVAHHYPRQIGQKEKPGWREYVNTMLKVAEPVDAGEDATIDGEFRGILKGFLDSRGVVQCPEGEVVKSAEMPFERKGRVWLRIEGLAQYMRVFSKPPERRALVQRLTTAGAEFKHHKVQGRKNGTMTTARFYGIPRGLILDENETG